MSLLLPRTLTLDATTGWVSMNPPTGADQRSFRCLALPAPIVFSDELKPVRSAEEPYVSQSAAEAAAGSTSTAATLRATPARRFTAGHSTGRNGGRPQRMPHSPAWAAGGGPRHGAACASLLDGELRALRRRRLVAGGVLRRPDQEVLAATEPLALQLPVEGELVRADLTAPDDAAREREVALLALAVLLRERLALAVHLAPRAALQHAEGDGGRLGQLEADFRGLLELERSRLHQKLEQRR